MPNSTTDNQAMIGQTVPDARSRSGIHTECRGFNDRESFKQRKCSKSFVLFLLVGYGLLQISSNLNHHDHMLVNAAQTNSTLQTNHDKDKDIIILNATNFEAELIQYQHPFPHIKVVEYYLPYCGICRKFKQTFTHLSKDIYCWRNVIRPAQLDMAVSYNTPIAQSWSIEVVPTLRIHPTLNFSLAEGLNTESMLLSRSMKGAEYQKFMYKEYTSVNPATQTLNVLKYTNDSKLEDKVSALKHDLMSYIQHLVRERPHEIPATWPNLRPVTEKTLAELRLNHPRKELFLIVESGDNNQADHIDLGFQVILGLSSSAAWRAIRYVRVRDNEELLEDVISFKKRELQEHVDNQSNDQIPAIQEQLKLLEALRQGEHNQSNNLILIHIDDSYSIVGHSANAVSTQFPFLEVITGHDFVVEEELNTLVRATDAAGEGRSKRGISSRNEAISNKMNQRSLGKRALNEDMNNLNLTRKIELAVFYVNQTYVPTREDEEFISALSKFDENPTSYNSKKEASKKLKETQKYTLPSQGKHHQVSNLSVPSIKKAIGEYFSLSPESLWSSPIRPDHSDCDYSDYGDKLRAIRFIFLQEVPRQSFVDKSPTGKVEKLNNLINLAAVIKAYFPLPDSASVQFIDAVHGYLSSQLSQLLLNGPDRNSTGNFDFRSLRQFIKNIEAEGKRLPEINNWGHCAKGEFHCAIWRLFHTLTAFEYKKLTQISTSIDSQPLIPSRKNHQAVQQSSPLAQIAERSASEGPTTFEHQNSLPSPVERVVSPPSATTSLSLTIVTPISNHGQHSVRNHNKPAEIAELPTPVLLVMRDYVVNFFSCPKCASLFREETADLSFERIRHQEPAEFSILWLWETHNLISKRLSVSPATNPPNNPKKWFPTYEQCSRCYKKPPSYLKETSLEPAAIFHESIEWNRDEILNFLQVEFTKQPMDTILLGVPMSLALYYSIIMAVCLSFIIVLLRCASYYIERQRRHKASMLNGVQYSEELQRC